MAKRGRFEKQGITRSYSIGAYNKYDDNEQWIRISQGCPNKCSFCYEPPEEKVFLIPEIVRNDVKIMDMNLLSKTEALNYIENLGKKRVNGRVVQYELVCGIDHRFLTAELAAALKRNRFRDIRVAWDYGFSDQYKIKDAIALLIQAGYSKKGIMIFMICNWRISLEECKKKAYLCAIWNVLVSDCYFDGQVSPNISPIGWTEAQIYEFRRLIRKHNQMVKFGIDPEVKTNRNQKTLFAMGG